MQNLFNKVAFLFSFILFVSCTNENIYNFKELSNHDDYIIELKVYFEDIDEDYSFTITDYKTTGYNKFEYWSAVWAGATVRETKILKWAVKEYKKVGLKFIPEKNVQKFRILIYNLEYSEVISQYHSEGAEEVSVYYDFEKGKDTVILN